MSVASSGNMMASKSPGTILMRQLSCPSRCLVHYWLVLLGSCQQVDAATVEIIAPVGRRIISTGAVVVIGCGFVSTTALSLFLSPIVGRIR